MLVKKPKRGPVSDSDGAMGAHRLVGALPRGAWLWISAAWRKIQPLLGVEGVTLAISTPAQKTRGDFCIAKKLKKLSALPCLGEALRRVPSYFDTIFIVLISVTTRVAKIKEIKTKNSTLFFPAFQLLLKLVIRICHGNHRNCKCRYENEPERIYPGKYT